MDRPLTFYTRPRSRGRTSIAGHHFSAADVHLGSSLGWGMRFDTIPQREAFVAFVEHLRQHPARQRAQQRDDALLQQPGV